MSTFTVTRVDYEENPQGVVQSTDVVQVTTGPRGLTGATGADGPPGAPGPNSISDNTDLGTLTNAVADALSLLATNAAGTKARRVALAAIHRAVLAAADAAGVRSAIGLGDSATRNVGSGVGTVAAGDDSRFPVIPPIVTALIFG